MRTAYRLLGILLILALAVLLSSDRKAIRPELIGLRGDVAFLTGSYALRDRLLICLVFAGFVTFCLVITIP